MGVMFRSCVNFDRFLLSRIRSIQGESIVIVKKFELEILTNLLVLDLPESEKHNFGIMSVCEHDYSKTMRATGMTFGPVTKCSTTACANRGICVQMWNSYTCDCDMTSYTGPTCSDGKLC
ncbi:hypothetical protein AVEN_29789-1 [Araneus ventricosus]|uniref:EGF-like domain-containing protein n=1 Tax=Araneus ventricosus TaxID=182803 RepID=A0A4Y2WTB7_ARAVE|nr:hypothetical protein AVEN_29789-1 [Araneus ventricosus]